MFRACWIGLWSLVFALLASPHARAQQAEASPWEFFGAARLRAEFNDAGGRAEGNRQGLRLRLGIRYTVNEELDAVVRASTGQDGNPRSGFHWIGEGFDRLELSLDQLYVAYSPEAVSGATVFAGKFPRLGYRSPFYSDLVWDSDLMPEGAALDYKCLEWGPFDSTGVGLIQASVLEQDVADDAWATMLFLHGQVGLSEESHLDLATHYYLYNDLPTTAGSPLVSGSNRFDGAELASEFGILHLLATYRWVDWIFNTEYVHNTRASSGVGDSGFVAGVGYESDHYGRFYFQTQTIEQDAVLASVVQDDFLYATNYQTHVAGWKRDLSDRTALHIWAQASQLDEDFGADDETVYRLRLDFDIRF